METAFSGIGAELAGGRFNSKGRKVVYTSGSLALAMLELLVHGNKRERLNDHYFIKIKISADWAEAIPDSDLPADWKASPPRSGSQVLGDTWLTEGRSLLLRVPSVVVPSVVVPSVVVPSVVVPSDFNYLINPHHADFSKLKFESPQPVLFDSRLLQK